MPTPGFDLNDIVKKGPKLAQTPDAATAIKNRNKDIKNLLEGDDTGAGQANPSPTPAPPPGKNPTVQMKTNRRYPA